MNYGMNIYKTMCNYSKWSRIKIGEIEKRLGKPKGWFSRLPKRDNITLNEVLLLKNYVHLDLTIDEFISNVHFEDRLLREECCKIENQIAELQERLKEVNVRMIEGDKV